MQSSSEEDNTEKYYEPPDKIGSLILKSVTTYFVEHGSSNWIFKKHNSLIENLSNYTISRSGEV